MSKESGQRFLAHKAFSAVFFTFLLVVVDHNSNFIVSVFAHRAHSEIVCRCRVASAYLRNVSSSFSALSARMNMGTFSIPVAM